MSIFTEFTIFIEILYQLNWGYLIHAQCWAVGKLLLKMASVCIIQRKENACNIISHCRFCKEGYEAGLDDGRQKGLAEGFAAA